MTGPSTFSSLLTTERPAINLPRDVEGLRAECKKRGLPTLGSKTELTDRLSAHETVNSRTYTTSTPSRPTPSSTSSSTSTNIPTRHLNTSRALKAVADTSTIDFAYLPDFDPDLSASTPLPRIPLLPSDVYASKSVPTYAAAKGTEGEVEVASFMKPEIVVVSGGSGHVHAPSAMSEVSDSGAVDFQGMVGMVEEKLGKAGDKAVEEGGMARQVWGGVVDDLFGPKGRKTAA